MRHLAFLTLLCVAGGPLFLTAAEAKGPVDKIAILRAGSTQPIEITDEVAIAGFDPWGRQFIDWDRGVSAEPPPGVDRYTVSFYLKGRVIYVVEYAPEPGGDGGYVYVPGSGHWAARINGGTIITASSDRWNPNGKWQHATTGWAELMASESGVQPPTTGDGGLR